MSTRLYVKLPAMPRTRDARTTHVTFAKRTTRVRADTVERIELIANAEKSGDTVTNGDFTTGTDGEVFHAADEMTRHRSGFQTSA